MKSQCPIPCTLIEKIHLITIWYTWWLLFHPILHVLCIRYLDNTLINSYWYELPITGNFQIFIIFQNHTLWLPDSCTICSCLDPVSVCESVRCLNPNCFYSKVSRDHDHHYWKSSFVLFYLINFYKYAIWNIFNASHWIKFLRNFC